VECTPNSFLPRLVLQHPSIDAVFAGAHHSIAMERHSSLVFGWGSNGVGQANPSMEASRIVEPSQWNLNSKTVLA
jgi:hypothetical protein